MTYGLWNFVWKYSWTNHHHLHSFKNLFIYQFYWRLVVVAHSNKNKMCLGQVPQTCYSRPVVYLLKLVEGYMTPRCDLCSDMQVNARRQLLTTLPSLLYNRLIWYGHVHWNHHFTQKIFWLTINRCNRLKRPYLDVIFRYDVSKYIES